MNEYDRVKKEYDDSVESVRLKWEKMVVAERVYREAQQELAAAKGAELLLREKLKTIKKEDEDVR